MTDISTSALEELRAYGWLEDGSLEGLALNSLNLPNSDLFRANLSKTDLSNSNFSKARLTWANLVNADLFGANLCGAILDMADLTNSHLTAVEFDRNTVLPDNTKWTPNTDMSRFTNLQHPNYWSLPIIVQLKAKEGDLLISDREWQILALVAEKLTYREIGERLQLSTPRVAQIVNALLKKLGMNKRSEIIIWFNQQKEKLIEQTS